MNPPKYGAVYDNYYDSDWLCKIYAYFTGFDPSASVNTETKHPSYSKVISLAPSLQGWKTLHSILPGLFTLLTRALRPPIAGYFGACFPHCKVYRNKVMWVMWVMCKFPWLTKQIQLHPWKSRKSWQLMEFRTLICELVALSKAPSICCKSMLAKPCRVLSLHWTCQNVENALDEKERPRSAGRRASRFR